MSSATNGGHRDKAALRSDIEHTRRDIEEHLNALQGELSPGQLVDRAFASLKGSGGKEFVSNLGRSVADHPIPALVAAVGLAWLAAAERSGPPPRRGAEDEESGARRLLGGGSSPGKALRERLGHRTEDTGARAEQLRDEARARATRASASVSERAGQATESARHAAESARAALGRAGTGARAGASQALDRGRMVAERVGTGARSVSHEVWTVYETRPLVGLLAAFGMGALVGALLPPTETERRQLGPLREGLLDEARRKGEDLVETGRRVARAAVDAGAAEARGQAEASGRDQRADAPRTEVPETDDLRTTAGTATQVEVEVRPIEPMFPPTPYRG